MKRLLLLFILVFMSISCEQTQDFIDTKGHGLVFIEGEMKAYFPSQGDTKNYKFNADFAWTADVSADWVSVNPTSGPAGENKIHIKVDKNKSDQRRKGYVDVTLSNSQSCRIELEQLAVGENLSDVIPVAVVPNSEIWYTTTDGNVLTLNENAEFNANLVSNMYIDGKGVIKFDGDLVEIGAEAFAGCATLSTICLPVTLRTFGVGAFKDCVNMTGVYIYDLEAWCNMVFENPKSDDGMQYTSNPINYATNLYLNDELIVDLVIPDGVTKINDCAFTCCSIESLSMSDDVVTIGDHAFAWCYNLSNLELSNSLITIDNNAFLICVGLTNVIIPDSVTTIGDYAFAFGHNITSVTIGESVTYIGDSAFVNCFVNSIDVPIVFCKPTIPPIIEDSAFVDNSDRRRFFVPTESLEVYQTADGWREYCDYILGYDYETGEISPAYVIEYTSTDGNIVTPDMRFCDAIILRNVYKDGKGTIYLDREITTIGYETFDGCYNLESITIPDSVTTIGRQAFEECNNLKSITLGEGLTTIEDYAFNICHSLTSITIPNSVIDIRRCAFSACDSLSHFEGKFASEDGLCLVVDGRLVAFATGSCPTEFVIPDYVTVIGERSLARCQELTNITIPNSVTLIERLAFEYCYKLTSVVIPDSVTMIGDGAFALCYDLSRFNGKFATEDGRCLVIDGRVVSFAPAGLTEWIIANDITAIGDNAFDSCGNLTSITIPDSVTTIGDEAFEFCMNLTSVTIPHSVTTIGLSAFTDCWALSSVYCESATPPTAKYDGFDRWYTFDIFNSLPEYKIYVPMESVEAYKNADGWSYYADAIVGYNFK